jgi:signal transduction histidine kinase
MEANRESDKEDMLAEIRARRDANTKEMNATQERMNTNLKDLKEDMKSSQAEMRSTVCTFRSELKETIQREMRAVIQPIRTELDETTFCNEAMETEPDPRMMQSIEEHQENPKGEAAVMLAGEPS